MKMKSKQLENKRRGKGKQSQWDSKPYRTKNGLALLKSSVTTSILTDKRDFRNLTKEELNRIIDEKLGNKLFLTKEEGSEEVNLLEKTLYRYILWEKQQNREVLDRNLKGEVEIKDELVPVTAHLSFLNKDDSVEIVAFKNKKPDYTMKPKSEKNDASFNIDLYAMLKLGQERYKDKNIIVSYYYLKGRRDSEKDMKVSYNAWLDEDIDTIATEREEFMRLRDETTKTATKKKWQNRVNYVDSILSFEDENNKGNNIISMTRFNFENMEDKTSEVINSENICDKCEGIKCRHNVICNHKFTTEEYELVSEVKKSDGKVRLTDKQRDIVENTSEGIYRVNATAGSGKSFSMTMRYIELLKQGCKPSEILCTTFTNKGAEELRDKIIYWCSQLGVKGIARKQIKVYTFNSFSKEIVEKEWVRLGYNGIPDLESNIDTFDIIRELLEKYDSIPWINYKNPMMSINKNVKGIFHQLKEYFTHIKLNGVIDVEDKEQKDDIMMLFNEYNTMLMEKDATGHTDQILLAIKLFENYPDLIQRYGFKHIVVDEAQDTNSMQEKLIHLLTQYKAFKSLVIVGDNDQAIFSFMNTSPELMLNFHERFNGVVNKFLTDNFRSTPQVCSLANRLIKLNENRIDKEIVAFKPNGENVKLLEFDTMKDEVLSIAQDIKNNNVELHETSVIARSKKDLLLCQEVLRMHGIPCKLAVAERFIDNLSVQHIINLTEFFLDTDVDYPLFENMWITHGEFRELSDVEQKIRIEQTKSLIVSDFESMKDETNKIDYFNNYVYDILEKDEIAEQFIKKVNEKQYHTFYEYATQIKKYILYQDDTKVEKDDVKRNCITLTTAHSSKGKEWKKVYVMLDSFKKEEDIELLEEERRLLFVAVTRAKDELIMTYNTKQDAKRGKGKVGDFVEEIKELM